MCAGLIPAVRSPSGKACEWNQVMPGSAWTAASAFSVHPRLRRDGFDVFGEWLGMHRPVVDRDLAGDVVEPGERVLHPDLVVALFEVLAGVGPTALGAV